MKKIMTLALLVVGQVQTKDAISFLEDSEREPKKVHSFHRQAANLGKKARENLYESEFLEHFSFNAPAHSLADGDTSKNDVTITFRLKGGSSQVVEKTSVNYQDDKGRSALHLAAFTGNLECMKILVGCGADINIQDSLGWTPLHCAAFAGHVNIIAYLLEKGADRKLTTKTGATAYWVAAVGQGTNAVVRTLDGTNEPATINLVTYRAVVSS